MFQYTIRRVLIFIPMLLGVMSLVFFAMRILPGDVCLYLMGDEATTEALADCVRNLGLDRPLIVQYANYMWKALHFDFGRSLVFNYTVASYILRMLPHTVILVMSSTFVALCIGLPSGVISALNRQNPLIDYSARVIALFGLSMPVFWFGILMLIAFSLYWDLFPLIGGGDLDTVLTMIADGEVFEYPEDFLAAVGDVLHHLVLPGLTLGFAQAAFVSRLARSAMLEVISQDYIRTARSKGLRERLVIYKHAMRNMLIPLLTIIGLFVAFTLGGTVLTETVFTRPGLGKMVVDAIGARDYPLAQGAITMIAMTTVTVNLIVDLLYAVVDPRITYR